MRVAAGSVGRQVHPVEEARDLLLAFAADPDADWDTQAPPGLNPFHAWVTAVLPGTNDVITPGQALADVQQVERTHWPVAEPPPSRPRSMARR